MPLFNTTEERRLLGEVLERPDDDGPRLVLADLLQSRGEPFGEFIALQLQEAREPLNWEAWRWNQAGGARGLADWPLPRLLDAALSGERPDGGVPREVLVRRRRLVELEGISDTFTRQLLSVPVSVEYRRGFPARAFFSPAALLDAAGPLLAPLESVEVLEVGGVDVLRLAAHPWTAAVPHLKLRATEPVPAPAPRAVSRPRLKALQLSCQYPLEEGTLATLAQGGLLEAVETLGLPAVRWRAADERELLAHTPSLRALSLEVPRTAERMTQPGPTGLVALFGREGFAQLSIDGQQLTAAALEDLLRRAPTWVQLCAHLDARVLGPPGLAGGGRSRRGFRVW